MTETRIDPLLIEETVDAIRENAWQQGRKEGETYGAGRYNEHFTAGAQEREMVALLQKLLHLYLDDPAAHRATLEKVVR